MDFFSPYEKKKKEGKSRSSSIVTLVGLNLLGQFGDDFAVCHRLDVAAEHVEDPPVADVELGRDGVDDLLRHETVARVQNQRADARHGQQHGPERRDDTSTHLLVLALLESASPVGDEGRE